MDTGVAKSARFRAIGSKYNNNHCVLSGDRGILKFGITIINVLIINSVLGVTVAIVISFVCTQLHS